MASSGTDRRYPPVASLVVPWADPLTLTETPDKGCPAASVTVPRTSMAIFSASTASAFTVSGMGIA